MTICEARHSDRQGYPVLCATVFNNRTASRVTHLLGRLRRSNGQVRETVPQSQHPSSS
jgi:hypothetical protein